MSKENAPLAYYKSNDKIKYVTHEFLFGFRNKKVKVPSYENESEEVLLHMLRELIHCWISINFCKIP